MVDYDVTEANDETFPETRSDSRLSYAKLLSRVFEADIGACRRCGGELPALRASRPLGSLLGNSSAPPRGRARIHRKPYYTGQTQLVLSPEAFLRRLFAIIPPPRWHLTRYHGIFSGHHRMRPKLATLLPEPPPPPVHDHATAGIEMQQDEELPSDNPSRLSYAQLLSRVFEQDIGSCQRCGGELRFIACIDDRPSRRRQNSDPSRLAHRSSPSGPSS